MMNWRVRNGMKMKETGLQQAGVVNEEVDSRETMQLWS